MADRPTRPDISTRAIFRAVFRAIFRAVSRHSGPCLVTRARRHLPGLAAALSGPEARPRGARCALRAHYRRSICTRGVGAGRCQVCIEGREVAVLEAPDVFGEVPPRPMPPPPSIAPCRPAALLHPIRSLSLRFSCHPLPAPRDRFACPASPALLRLPCFAALLRLPRFACPAWAPSRPLTRHAMAGALSSRQCRSRPVPALCKGLAGARAGCAGHGLVADGPAQAAALSSQPVTALSRRPPGRWRW